MLKRVMKVEELASFCYASSSAARRFMLTARTRARVKVRCIEGPNSWCAMLPTYPTAPHGGEGRTVVVADIIRVDAQQADIEGRGWHNFNEFVARLNEAS